MLNKPRYMARQRGLSLVELMVGIAVGMFVVAAAATLVSAQLVDNRKLLLEVQVQQDLRSAADIIARDLRRAGSWGGDIASAQFGLATPLDQAQVNPLADVSPTGTAAATEVDYSSARVQGTSGPYGFKLEGGVIKSRLSDAGWQALTDESTMTVTIFTVRAQNETPVRIACTKQCSDGTQNCWPTVTVRSFIVDITGQSVSDASVKRSVHSEVRLRNDLVSFNDPAFPSLACPV